MPFQYDQVEDEVVARLISVIPDFDIVPLPQKSAEFKNPDERPRITVAYGGSEFPAMKSTNESRQDENVTVLINITSRLLRGDVGIYSIIEKVINALLGFRLSNIDRLLLKSIEFDNRDESTTIFSYNVTMIGKKLRIQILSDAADDGPPLQTVTLNDVVQLPN